MCVVLLTGQADALQQLQQAAGSFEQHLTDSDILQVSHMGSHKCCAGQGMQSRWAVIHGLSLYVSLEHDCMLRLACCTVILSGSGAVAESQQG